MNRKIHLRFGGGSGVLLAVALLMAACAGPGQSGSGTVASPAPVALSAAGSSVAPTSAATATTAGPELATDFVRDETSGPGEFGLTEGEIIRRYDSTEGLIAQCMSDAGFEYFPVDYETGLEAMDVFLEQFGLGITTRFTATPLTLSAGKRNDQYKAGLSPADVVAYDRTLYGEDLNDPFIVALDREDLTQVGGCTRAAVQLIFSEEELGVSFVNAANLFESRIDADPRVIAAYEDWGGCMREAGYAYDDPSEIEDDLAARLDQITAGAAPGSLSAEATAALTELQGEERVLAALDLECDLEFVVDIKAKVETELMAQA